MTKGRKKNKFSRRPIVLGFDETNNGLGLKSLNPNHSSSIIVTGYLGENTRKGKNYQGSKFEDKFGAFNGKKNIEESLQRGRSFLQHNPNFLYTSIPPEYQASTPMAILKANAIALLTLNFLLTYELNPNEIQIISDEMDGKENSKKVGDVLNMWLEKTELTLPYRFIQGAEHSIIPVRKADRVGYYLTAIHLLGNNHKWPYRSHKINFDTLEQCVINYLDTKEKYYLLP